MSGKRRNVIWIFGDQHRAHALSCNGDPNVNTPNIDRLALEGRNFRRAVSGFPLCCPFRGSLLTGEYPHKCVPGHEYPLPKGMKTVAHAFGEHDYDTAWFGKWHVAGWHERDGRCAFYKVPKQDRGGFDVWLGYDNNNSQFDSWVHGHDEQDREIEHYRLPGYETDCLTDLMIEYIRTQEKKREANGETSFFAALSVQPPHDPYIAPAEFMSRHNPQEVSLRPNVPAVPRVEEKARRDLAGAYAMIENLDWNIGRILEALSETGLAEDTYIVFFSDHGDLHGSHGQFKKTAPWEEAIRIPFIVAGGPSVYDCRRGADDRLVNHVDIAPTSLGLAGLDTPEWMKGVDYSGLFRRDREAGELPDSAFIQYVVPTGHGDSVDRPWRAVVTLDGWKYVVLEHQPWLLFNLNEDPCEQANLAHNPAFAGKRAELQARLRAWMEKTGDEFLLPEIDSSQG